MTNMLPDSAIFHTQVVADYIFVAGTGAQNAAVPSEGTDASIVVIQFANHRSLVDVPDLRRSLVGPDGHVIAFVAPSDTGHRINLTELVDLRRAGGPDVNSACQPDGKLVLTAPVDKVQVEVVLKLRRV